MVKTNVNYLIDTSVIYLWMQVCTCRWCERTHTHVCNVCILSWWFFCGVREHPYPLYAHMYVCSYVIYTICYTLYAMCLVIRMLMIGSTEDERGWWRWMGKGICTTILVGGMTALILVSSSLTNHFCKYCCNYCK